MKHAILSVALLLTAGGLALAQEKFELPANEPALVYSLPRTELCVEVDVEKVTEIPGEFCQYSGRYLAEKDVITEEKTSYRVKEVRVHARAVSDPARTYVLTAMKDVPMQHIAVDRRGLLRGINVPPETATHKLPQGPQPKPEVLPAVDKPLPLTEEYMLASSVSKMAEGAARQIYRIRESRLSLLTADVDQLPADGESLKTMLKGMDDMEKELTELFVGTKRCEVRTHTLHLTPAAAMKDEVLFRLSPIEGLVDANDLSGSPFYINVTPETIDTYQPKSAGKKASAAQPLYSVLPATTQVSISDGKEVLFSRSFSMPQFGQTVPIPAELLQNKDVRIYIDENTGRLLTVASGK